jgi:hypothetical protein
LANADLTGATYTVITGPPASYVAHIQGLEAVTFTPGNETGLVQIRESLQKAGLRHLEREATYAIERNRTWYAICGLVVPNSITSSITSFIRNLIIWDVDVWESCITLWETAKLIKDSEEKNEVVKSYEEFGTLFEGLVRLAFFEWTTGYGFYPFRAIYIIVGLGGGLILVYVLPIRFAAPPPRAGSSHYQNWFLGSMTRGWLGLRQRWANGKICRVWSADRIKESWDEIRGITIEVKNEPEAERLCGDWRFALKYAAYFSLLSIFHIGWRDLNVGTWIARIQPGEYVLRPAGWVKFISGIQSLLSVYLLAIWALTYFGRPFQ